MTDNNTAVSGYDAGYVPCPDVAATEPGVGDDGAAVVGYDAGYVAVGDAAASEPSTDDNGAAVVGYSAGYVPNPCTVPCGITDTFDRPDQAGMGMADCGLLWSSDAGCSIVSDQLVMDLFFGPEPQLNGDLPFPVSGSFEVVSAYGTDVIPEDIYGELLFPGSGGMNWDYNQGDTNTFRLFVTDGASSVTIVTPVAAPPQSLLPAPFSIVIDSTHVSVDFAGTTLTALYSAGTPSPLTPPTGAHNFQFGMVGTSVGDGIIDNLDIVGLNRCTHTGGCQVDAFSRSVPDGLGVSDFGTTWQYFNGSVWVTTPPHTGVWRVVPGSAAVLYPAGGPQGNPFFRMPISQSDISGDYFVDFEVDKDGSLIPDASLPGIGDREDFGPVRIALLSAFGLPGNLLEVNVTSGKANTGTVDRNDSLDLFYPTGASTNTSVSAPITLVAGTKYRLILHVDTATPAVTATMGSTVLTAGGTLDLTTWVGVDGYLGVECTVDASTLGPIYMDPPTTTIHLAAYCPLS